MRKLIAAVLFCFPGAVLAQTASFSVDSMWAPFSIDSTITASVQALKLDATTGKLVAIAGQTQQLGSLTKNVIAAVLPGQKTTAMTVNGLRLNIVSGGFGWTGSGTVEVRLPAAITVPAGKGLAVRYDAPFIGKGTVQLAVGVTSIAAPIAPPGSVTGPITPAPTPVPPPPTGPSAPGASIPPLAELIGSDGAKWTFTAPKAFRNGVDTQQPYSDANLLYVSAAGTIRAQGPSHGYVCWTGAAWAGLTGC